MSLRNIKAESAIVIIYNMLGQKINEINITAERMLNGQFEIEVTALAAGVYYIQFESGEYSDTRKIIKSN